MKVHKDEFKKGQKEAKVYLVLPLPYNIKSHSYYVFIVHYDIFISHPNKSPKFSLKPRKNK